MFLRREAKALAALAIMAVALALGGLGSRDLWFEKGESQQAWAAWRLSNGASAAQLFFPEGSAPFSPLVPAAIALSFKIAGSSDIFPARIPSVLFSLASLAAVFLATRAIHGPMAGVFAVGALSTSFLFSFMARSAAPDMAIAFFQTAALAALIDAAKSLGKGWGIRWFWILLGGVYYAGGPAAVALPLAGSFMAARGGSFGRDGARKVADPLGIILFLGAIAPWCMYAISSAGFTAQVSGLRPAMAGVYGMLIKSALFLPWIFAVPSSIDFTKNRTEGLEKMPIQYLAGAFLAACALSVIGKTEVPHIHAVMGLIVAGYIVKSQAGGDKLWKAPFISLFIAILPLLGALAIIFIPNWSASVPFFPSLYMMAFLVVFYISYKGGEMFAESGETLGMWAGAMVSMFAFLALFHMALAPLMNRSFSHKVFFGQVTALTGGHMNLYQYGVDSFQARYYLRKDEIPILRDAAGLSALLGKIQEGDAPIYLLTNERSRALLEKKTAKGRGKATVFIDSYFVPAINAAREDRLYVFKYPPDPAPRRP